MIFYAERQLMIGSKPRNDGHVYPPVPHTDNTFARKALDWLSANAKSQGLFDIFQWTGPAGEEPPRWDVKNIVWEYYHSDSFGSEWICLHVVRAT